MGRTPAIRIFVIAWLLSGTAFHSVASAAVQYSFVTSEALQHAVTIEEAWRRLEQHILLESNAATVWQGDQPGTVTGWRQEWTDRGLGARYCDDTLVVHAVRDVLKGVGLDQRTVRNAPHLDAARKNRRSAPLHWLDQGVARGHHGRADLDLPACMNDLPDNRVALAGLVPDPFNVVRDVTMREREIRDCPPGRHGDGRTFVRETTMQVNGRGDDTGTRQTSPWRLQADRCAADFADWEFYRIPCSFQAGEPHNGELAGEQVWRRLRTVNADGTSWGTPEFVATSCWNDPAPVPPDANLRRWSATEQRTVGCASGQSGTQTQERTVQYRSVQFPWDENAIVTEESATTWVTRNASCTSSGTPGSGRDGIGIGWDTDGDRRPDYAKYADIPDHEKPGAVPAAGNALPGRNNAGCGSCGRDGPSTPGGPDLNNGHGPNGGHGV